MDALTLRITDTISSNLGSPLSINKLTEKIKDAYGTAYYPNIYRKLQLLKDEGFINLDLIGRSSVIRLNFQSYLLTSLLAEMELEKEREFLKKRPSLYAFLEEMEKSLHEICPVRSVSFTYPERNIKLNRIELLFLLRKIPSHRNETISLYKEMRELQNKHNLRVDSLVLDEDEFADLIRSNEINPLREALANKITFYRPQAFWSEIKRIAEETEIRAIREETKPTDISDQDIVYNWGRFGYREFGSTMEQGREYCIEYLAISLLLGDDSRRLEAVPIILAKNSFRSNLLAFLSQKYGTSGRLLGILKVLQDIRPKNEVGETIELLVALDVEAVPADEGSILRRMKLYNAA